MSERRRRRGAHRAEREEAKQAQSQSETQANTDEPVVVVPVRSLSIRQRLDSPWLVAVQYIFNIAIVVLILMLFFNQAKFSDYLEGRGAQRDREAAVAEQQAAERAERSRMVLCELIAALEADIGGRLERISRIANCDEGPQEPGASAETPAEASPTTTPTTTGNAANGSSNGVPSTDTGPPTGDQGSVNAGPQSPAPAPGAPPPTNSPPSTSPQDPGGNGGLLEDVDKAVDVCVIILGCVV